MYLTTPQQIPYNTKKPTNDNSTLLNYHSKCPQSYKIALKLNSLSILHLMLDIILQRTYQHKTNPFYWQFF